MIIEKNIMVSLTRVFHVHRSPCQLFSAAVQRQSVFSHFHLHIYETDWVTPVTRALSLTINQSNLDWNSHQSIFFFFCEAEIEFKASAVQSSKILYKNLNCLNRNLLIRHISQQLEMWAVHVEWCFLRRIVCNLNIQKTWTMIFAVN